MVSGDESASKEADEAEEEETPLPQILMALALLSGKSLDGFDLG